MGVNEIKINPSGTPATPNAVLYTKQTLNKAEQAQARENIGAMSSDTLPDAVNDALAQAKESGEFDGEDGRRGTGLIAITTTPSAYTTEINGLTPAYRVALSTVKSQGGVAEVLVGDVIQRSYYHYPVIYVDSSYVYCRARVSIRGAAGANGYTPVKGTDYWTETDKAEIKSYVDDAILGGAW